MSKEKRPFDIELTGVSMTPKGTTAEFDIKADGQSVGDGLAFMSNPQEAVSDKKAHETTGSKGKKSFGMHGDWSGSKWIPEADKRRAEAGKMQKAARQARNTNPGQN